MSYSTKSIKDYFNEQALNSVRKEIERANGNEVLIFGTTDEKNMIDKIEVVTRGNNDSVAVPIEKSFNYDVIVHNHPGGNLTPSAEDMNISTVIANRGVAFFIVNNEVTEVYTVVEPVKKKTFKPLDAEKLVSFVSINGSLNKYMSDFEERDGQKKMVRYICDSFNKNFITLIEAGTGIGKSIAYLIPSIEWAINNKDRVVISTNTINLQEQLLHKDIPDLKRALNYDFSYILMKGRRNYICLNRVYEAKQELFAFIDDEEIEQFNTIVEWVENTLDGSLSDLPFIPKVYLWDKLSSQTETCMGIKCEYFSRCFVNKIKRKAISSQIVVTNHHYLLADASLSLFNASILPSYSRVIFDEAHNLEDSATSFFTREFSLFSVMGVLNRLYSSKNKKGYLAYLLNKGNLISNKKANRLIKDVKDLKSILYELFEGIDQFLSSIRSRKVDNYYNKFIVVEVNDEIKNDPSWEKRVIKNLGIFYNECSRLLDNLDEIRKNIPEEDERAKKRIEGFIMRFMDFIETINIFLKDEDREYVRYIESKKEARLMVSPIDVGEKLYELLFKRVKSSVLTSATLTVGKSFNFIRHRLSLRGSVKEKRISSPFDYNKQMAILIPADVVEPNNQNYADNIKESIKKILIKTGGKAIILFTSYKVLNDIYAGVKDMLSQSGIITFKQGDDSRNNLLRKFKHDINSVLFGTDSFWEGVDAPGKTLECIVITKLPFKVPTEPIIKARMDLISERDGNPFMEFALPLAVIKMKQGIGRLIRKKTDKGIIVILDKRIITKKYGSIFIDSIPSVNIYEGYLEDILCKAKDYLSNKSLTK